jgi:serine/threonine protein phosphatase PrpC
MRVVADCASLQGTRESQEDASTIAFSNYWNNKSGMVGVFDGAGGHAEGEVASAQAAATFNAAFEAGTLFQSPTRESIEHHSQLNCQGMTTAVVTAWLTNEGEDLPTELMFFHSGDSQCWVIKLVNNKPTIVFFTPVEGNLFGGLFTSLAAGQDNFELSVSETIVVGSTEEVVVFQASDGVDCLFPEFRRFQLEHLFREATEHVGDTTLDALLQEIWNGASAQTLCERAVQKNIAEDNRSDNTTIQIIRFIPE